MVKDIIYIITEDIMVKDIIYIITEDIMVKDIISMVNLEDIYIITEESFTSSW